MKNYLSRRNDFDLGFNNFFDGLDDFFSPVFFERKNEMRTDVKNTDNGYELSVDMPGYDKGDISISLDNGYVTISAKREDKEEDDKYLRRERSYSCSRSFYVGDGLTEEDIKAKYNNGTLVIDIPKIEKKALPKGHIEIQ